MKIVIVIPARMGSSRLKGKILKKIRNLTLIEILLRRLEKTKKIYKIIIATSKDKKDNKLVNFCKKNKVNFFRGSLHNVAKRFYEAGKLHNADAVVRVNGDSPLIDFRIINQGIKIFLKKKPDLVTNIFPRSFPIGQSVEIIKLDLFRKNLIKFKKKEYKEHITKYFYKKNRQFKILNFKNKKNLSNKRIVVDTAQDFEKIKKIIKKIKNPFDIDLNKIVKLMNNEKI